MIICWFCIDCRELSAAGIDGIRSAHFCGHLSFTLSFVCSFDSFAGCQGPRRSQALAVAERTVDSYACHG